jgi:hypothetical protein
MATKAEFDQVIERLNTATNKLAEKQRRDAETLKNALENAGLLGPEETAALASLNATADVLDALGADSADPVPAPEGEPNPDA